MMRPEPTQDERDRITIGAQQDKIGSLERRLLGAQRRIEYLESMLGWDKRALVDEVERLRRDLRKVHPASDPSCPACRDSTCLC